MLAQCSTFEFLNLALFLLTSVMILLLWKCEIVGGSIHKGRTPDPVFEVLFRLYDCNLLTFSAESLEVSKLNFRDHFYIFLEVKACKEHF